jgi:hypothetical protein
MTAKILFESTGDGKVTIEVKGNKSAVKVGLLFNKMFAGLN